MLPLADLEHLSKGKMAFMVDLEFGEVTMMTRAPTTVR